MQKAAIFYKKDLIYNRIELNSIQSVIIQVTNKFGLIFFTWVIDIFTLGQFQVSLVCATTMLDRKEK